MEKIIENPGPYFLVKNSEVASQSRKFKLTL